MAGRRHDMQIKGRERFLRIERPWRVSARSRVSFLEGCDHSSDDNGEKKQEGNNREENFHIAKPPNFLKEG